MGCGLAARLRLGRFHRGTLDKGSPRNTIPQTGQRDQPRCQDGSLLGGQHVGGVVRHDREQIVPNVEPRLDCEKEGLHRENTGAPTQAENSGDTQRDGRGGNTPRTPRYSRSLLRHAYKQLVAKSNVQDGMGRGTEPERRKVDYERQVEGLLRRGLEIGTGDSVRTPGAINKEEQRSSRVKSFIKS